MTTVREGGKVYTDDNVHIGMIVSRRFLTIAEDRRGTARSFGALGLALTWLEQQWEAECKQQMTEGAA